MVPFLCGVVRRMPCGSIVVWSGKAAAMWFHCCVECGSGCHVVPLLCGVVRWMPCSSIVVWGGKATAMWFYYCVD